GDELTKLLASTAPVGTPAFVTTSGMGTAAQSTTVPGSPPASTPSQLLPPCLVATTLAPAQTQTPVPKPMPLLPADAVTARFHPAASMRRGIETAHSDMMAGAGAPGQLVPPQVAIPASVPSPPATSTTNSVEDPQQQPVVAS